MSGQKRDGFVELFEKIWSVVLKAGHQNLYIDPAKIGTTLFLCHKIALTLVKKWT